MGTLPRAHGEESPHSSPAEARPGAAEARDAQGCRRPDTAAVVLRGDRRRGRRPRRRHRARRDPRPRQRREQLEVAGERRELQPPTGDSEDEAPWPPEYEFLADRLLPLGLTPLPREAVNTHYHS